MNIFKVNGKFNLGDLIISLLITLGGGYVIGKFIKESVQVYSTLNKPWFSPPAIVFPIVWTILYILMAIAAYRIFLRHKQGEKTKSSLWFYIIQLVLNFAWSIIFFNFKLYGLAFIELIILLIFIVITTIKFLKFDKIAGILMIPYIIWVSFAGVLNFFVWMLNEM
ncbi:TspO/MBR family protein [Clostridium perfringens]|uniref:TspO/MBR family protein n=1 Tax=Clostridium perfringens TaxID=1502 RepID=A0A2X3BUB9_CLOPF|nr:TspO/MBR family protein [Clostridium perfringens]SQC07712.1 TspO/MBR family protein [Clostridium perfringens]